MPGGPKRLDTAGPTSDNKRWIDAAYLLVLQPLGVISTVSAEQLGELTNAAANVAHPLASSDRLVTAWAAWAPQNAPDSSIHPVHALISKRAALSETNH